MRKFITIICTAAAIASAVGCAKLGMAEDVSIASRSAEEQDLIPVTLGISTSSATVETRDLSAYTDMLDYEKAVYSIQYLIFESGKILSYYKATSLTDNPVIYVSSAKSYSVYAYVNIDQDLSAVTEYSELTDLRITLRGDEKTTGFPMYGYGFINKDSKETSLTVPVYQQMSRIAVSYIKNSLPSTFGDLTIEGIFLATVPSKALLTTGLGGSSSYSQYKDYDGTWYNYRGRTTYSNTSTTYIDGTTNLAQMPDLTYRSIGTTVANAGEYAPSSPVLLYSYPNCAPTSSYLGSNTYTALIIIARINGELQYYNVPFNSQGVNATGLLNRSSYTLGVTITGFGSSDPMTKVSTTAVSSSIHIEEWAGNTVYEGTV